MNIYSFSELMKTIYAFAITKLTMPKARLIRRPVYMRGTKSIFGGKGLTTGRFCRFDLEGRRKTLYIGNDCEFGDMTHIVAHEHVEIGNNVLIASKCFISDTNHGEYKGLRQSTPDISPNRRKLSTKSVKIGNNVWVGENVVILSGVTIGDGCIIGANSVVNRDIPENTIAVGVPSKIVKRFHDEELCWKEFK